MSHLLDTDWAVQTLTGHPQARSAVRRLLPSQVGVSIVTLGELYEGAFDSPNHEAHLDALRGFLQSFRIVGLDEPIMVRFADLRAQLRHRGERLPDFDLLIAVAALRHDLT